MCLFSIPSSPEDQEEPARNEANLNCGREQLHGTTEGQAGRVDRRNPERSGGKAAGQLEGMGRVQNHLLVKVFSQELYPDRHAIRGQTAGE